MGKQDDLRTIGAFLEEAAEYGLEAEVVYTALRHIQEDPSTSVTVAMQIAMDEWIKQLDGTITFVYLRYKIKGYVSYYYK